MLAKAPCPEGRRFGPSREFFNSIGGFLTRILADVFVRKVKIVIKVSSAATAIQPVTVIATPA
jgi:hypothetical protein